MLLLPRGLWRRRTLSAGSRAATSRPVASWPASSRPVASRPVREPRAVTVSCSALVAGHECDSRQARGDSKARAAQHSMIHSNYSVRRACPLTRLDARHCVAYSRRSRRLPTERGMRGAARRARRVYLDSPAFFRGFSLRSSLRSSTGSRTGSSSGSKLRSSLGGSLGRGPCSSLGSSSLGSRRGFIENQNSAAARLRHAPPPPPFPRQQRSFSVAACY